MTEPKQIHANQIVMQTRRTMNQQFWLKPDRQHTIHHMFGFFYGVLSQRTGQQPHAAIVMSNHYHLIHTDVDAKRPEFLNQFNSAIARYTNRLHNRYGSLWDGGRCGDMFLADNAAIIEKLLYVWLNPIRAGIVDSLSKWKHFKITPEDWNKPMTFKRPSGLTAPWPESVTFTPTPPPTLKDIPNIAQHFSQLLKDAEDALKTERQNNGQSFGRMKHSYALNPWDKPSSLGLDKDTHKRRATPTRYKRSKNNPIFCAKCPSLRRTLKLNRRQFKSAYANALAEFKDDKSTVFPHGTYKMRTVYQVDINPPDPSCVLSI